MRECYYRETVVTAAPDGQAVNKSTKKSWFLFGRIEIMPFYLRLCGIDGKRRVGVFLAVGLKSCIFAEKTVSLHKGVG